MRNETGNNRCPGGQSARNRLDTEPLARINILFCMEAFSPNPGAWMSDHNEEPGSPGGALASAGCLLPMCRSSLRRLAAVALFLFCTTATVAKQDPGPTDENVDGQAPVLRLNVSTGGYPPYLIVSPERDYGGIVYDVVTRIAKRMGYRVEPLEVPRKRVDNLLLEGHVDATPRAREWTEHPERFLFTDTIVPVREVFFTTRDSDFRFRGLDRLSGVTLATPLGYQYPQLKPLFEKDIMERYEVSEDRDIFTFLLHGQGIDAGVADLLVGQWIIRQNGWQGEFRHSDQAISEFGYRLMLRPDWSSFAEAFNQQLAEMKASGELEAILNQYR